ncbi:YktB family protein [Jeotgalibacillus proteolyticus]|uniref:UPF0637 protein C4B60_02120 n=1 Tax=Jeotgalibacillus proteolyticus TaxID=2082395 RepID=A0A2S5GH11_9BACL|nr:DUF1054 domain-containing protein [Jeotgalibacillus proteolyticus]PPA72195.1 DUF1054 domain-containing protein [Jeotgalibacillus proteolyticus]
MTNGFEQKDFDIFQVPGLEERMELIQTVIQPKFAALGEELVPFLTEELNEDMHLHIARHARRTVNPPSDTWMAISPSKRGYKKLPHFQVGLWDDHLFIWLAYIYELPEKAEIAEALIDDLESVYQSLPEDGWISSDHMKKEADKINEMGKEDFLSILERFKKVKKAEFLVGKRFLPSDDAVQDNEKLIEEIKKTYSALLPIYRHSLKAAQK